MSTFSQQFHHGAIAPQHRQPPTWASGAADVNYMALDGHGVVTLFDGRGHHQFRFRLSRSRSADRRVRPAWRRTQVDLRRRGQVAACRAQQGQPVPPAIGVLGSGSQCPGAGSSSSSVPYSWDVAELRAGPGPPSPGRDAATSGHDSASPSTMRMWNSANPRIGAGRDSRARCPRQRRADGDVLADANGSARAVDADDGDVARAALDLRTRPVNVAGPSVGMALGVPCLGRQCVPWCARFSATLGEDEKGP